MDLNPELLEFFPEVVGVYTYDEEKHKVVKNICEDIKKKIGKGNAEFNLNQSDSSLSHYFNSSNSYLFDYTPEFKEFEEWTMDCAYHFMTKVHNYIIEEDNSVLITDAWMNVAGERTRQVEHNHHNSLMSGTYYVNKEDWVHEGLEFYKKRMENHPFIAHIRDYGNETKYTRNIETLQVKEGSLLLWASHLYHGYRGVLNIWPDRTTISMNFLPRRIDNGKYAFTIDKLG